MKIKDIVLNDYQGLRRYGVVVDKYMKGSWAYVRVRWVNDNIYEQAMVWREEMGQGDRRLYEYRVDQVKKVDAAREIAQLQRCMMATGASNEIRLERE
tara:strand:- start:1231 stop:1524 length:294 start_codon:yes stop_codon:yes gene_type:complete